MQVFRYCFYGGLAVVIQYAALYVGIEWLHIKYLAVAVIASLLNLYVSYVCQKRWTFKNKGKNNFREHVLPFLTMRVPMIFLNPPLLFVLVERCHLPVFAGQGILTVVFTTISYIFSVKIFAPKVHPDP